MRSADLPHGDEVADAGHQRRSARKGVERPGGERYELCRLGGCDPVGEGIAGRHRDQRAKPKTPQGEANDLAHADAWYDREGTALAKRCAEVYRSRSALCFS
jgi:hypothetical protein